MPLGRGSLMWDIAGEYRASLVIRATLLMQVMHPMVGAAVGEHSAFRTDPWGRAHRTSNSMLRYIYGGPLALQEGRRLRELHRPIEGIDARGRRYHALNGAACAWVNCSLFERYVTVRRLFGEPLDRGQEAALYRDTWQLGRVLHVPEREMPPTVEDFWRYFDDMVTNQLERNATTDEVLESLRHPKPPPSLPGPLAPTWRLPGFLLGRAAHFLTVGTLPAQVREILGLRWTGADQRRLDALAGGTRAAFPLLPERLRYVPAVARARAAPPVSC
jgi:uncharacterized protein (DUF2236 family)